MTHAATGSLSQRSVHYYESMADKRERDPISEDHGRATVPMGRGFSTWARFNNAGDVVWVTVDGREHWLTRKQADLLALSFSLVDCGMQTMRGMAKELNVSPSSVSRGLVKLQSLGLIAFLAQRGRYAGMLILRRVKGDGLDRYREAAKAKVRAWRLAAERRLSRLAFNVASYDPRGVERLYGVRWESQLLVPIQDATLRQAWSAEDVAGIV